MITVNDPYNLVPELFTVYSEFVKSNDADVDLLPSLCKESVVSTDKPTIFIEPEPTMSNVDQTYAQQITARPNATWAVSGISKSQKWTVKNYFLYLLNLNMTVKLNPDVRTVESGPKPWLATALFGGWTYFRGQLLHQLRLRNLLDQCLVNYRERTSNTEEDRDKNIKLHPHLYFNMRTPVIDELDLPLFKNTAFTQNPVNKRQQNEINTTIGIPGQKHSFGHISQLIPWNIYNLCYISIVAETEPGPCRDMFFVSEKISKPMLLGQPFVVFGSAGYLSELRNLGFRTFSPWIDESYDLILTNKERIQSIADSVEKFSQLSDQEKQYACDQMQWATQHNRLLMMDQQWAHGPLRDAILNFKKS